MSNPKYFLLLFTYSSGENELDITLVVFKTLLCDKQYSTKNDNYLKIRLFAKILLLGRISKNPFGGKTFVGGFLWSKVFFFLFFF